MRENDKRQSRRDGLIVAQEVLLGFEKTTNDSPGGTYEPENVKK